MVAANPYGAAVDSTASAIFAGNLLPTQNIPNAMTNSGASVFRYIINWAGIERAVQTTTTTAVTATGSQTITLASMPSAFFVGTTVIIEPTSSTKREVVTVTAISGNNLTATFAKTHTATSYVVSTNPQTGDTPDSSGSPARVQPYDWSVVDSLVTTAQSKGLLLDFVLTNAPTWHQQALAIDPTNNVSVASDAVTFTNALLSRYAANTFYAFETANEGFNSALLTSSNASSMFSQMYTLVSSIASVVRSLSPQTLVGAPAELNKTSANVSAWINGFIAANCPSLVDYVNIHYYNGNNGPTNPNAGEVSFPTWWAQWKTALPSKPLWVTEFGWTLLKNNNGGVPDATLAQYIQQFILSAISSNYIQRIIYYNLGQIAPGSNQNQDFTKQSYKEWKGYVKTQPNWPNPPIAKTPTIKRRTGTGPVTIRRVGIAPTIKRRTGVTPAIARRTGVTPTMKRRTGVTPTISRRES